MESREEKKMGHGLLAGGVLQERDGAARPLAVLRPTLRWTLFITWRTFGGSFAAVWIATIASKITFYSIFQALQDKQTFAPLTFQNFQIFAHVGDFCRFFQDVAENSLGKSQISRWNFHWFLSEFQEIADNCRKSLSFAPISRNSRKNGAKVHQFLINKFINSSRFGNVRPIFLQ